MGFEMNRRDILKAGVVSALAATTPGGARAEAESESKDKAIDQRVEPLADHAVTHGGIQQVHHPRLDARTYGQTCIRYLRFARPVRLERLEVGRLVYGRATPHVPTHPAHVVVSVLDPGGRIWKPLCDSDIPPDPAIQGEGLSQDMSADEMEAHFRKCLASPPHVIDLGGVRTDHLRVVCDREHPVWPNHGECNGGVQNVPFGILNSLQAYGVPEGELQKLTQPPPVLRQRTLKPRAPRGMTATMRPGMVLFSSKYLSIGFSLRRPMMMHLGWDALGQGLSKNDRLFVSRKGQRYNATGGVSGPIVRTLGADYPPSLWTGDVTIDGNRVIYSNLHAIDGVRIDATFTVERDRILIELTQECDADLPVVEAEAWRLAWDITKGITGMAGMPTQRLGRNGDVALPAVWATDGVGCLSCSLRNGKDVRMQVESYRDGNCVTGGFVFGDHPEPEACQTIPAGTCHAAFDLAVSNLGPISPKGARKPSAAVQRHWATVFSCFRPEFRGFSNHSASVNCHLSQGPPIEIVAHTQRPVDGPNPLDLARFTVGRALMDGGGYGYWRNLYLDSDPILLSAAGRIHPAEADDAWLKKIAPGVVETVRRMLAEVGQDGLVVCKDLSGNTGSYRWSSNSMDVVGFGHIDAYVNAWAYRGFRNAAALLDALPPHRSLATQCRETAARLRENYAPALVNPETKWVAGWRSRDGQLHDYGFTWVNGPAIAFGLLDAEASRTALLNLERKRDEVGLPNAQLGLPCNLLPIRQDDQMWSKIVNQLQPTFETYTDGSLSGWPATYYLRALSIHGLKDHAKKLAVDMAKGYVAGVFNGGNGSGREFCSWDGLPTGYEGTLIGCFGPMYGIAIEEGSLEPRSPEWWPENG